MNALMEKALQRLTQVPEEDQDHVARLVLNILQLDAEESEQISSQPLSSFLGAGGDQSFRTVEEVDAYIQEMRGDEEP